MEIDYTKEKVEITFNDYTPMERAQLLLEFIKICANGAIRPYDHSYYLRKIRNSPLNREEKESLSQCCPPDAEIRDALEFKPYMTAALEKLAGILELDMSNSRFIKHNTDEVSND